MSNPEARLLFHYTFATNHGVMSPRQAVSDDVIDSLKPLFRKDGFCRPFPGEYDVQITARNTSMLATIYYHALPLVEFGVCLRDGEAAKYVWNCVMQTSMATETIHKDAGTRPTHHFPQCLVALPILGWIKEVSEVLSQEGKVDLIDEIAGDRQFFTDLEMFADFERCLAWAYIEWADK